MPTVHHRIKPKEREQLKTIQNIQINISFTEEETRKSVMKSKNGKAPGLDSKIYENVAAGLSNRISTHFEKEHTFSNEQNGFRPHRSWLDHIYTLYNFRKILLDHKKDSFLTFIDFSKACDYVKKEYLLHKLLSYNNNGNVYNSIKAIYDNPVSCIQLGSTLSDWFPITWGLRQGDSLSLVLFATIFRLTILRLK